MAIKILGIKVDRYTRKEALEKLSAFFGDGRQHVITTPNPEIILAGYRDPAFASILNQADLALPDGVGLIFASWFLGKPIRERISGSDFIFDIAQVAKEYETSIYLVGGFVDVAKRAAETLRKNSPGVKIVGAEEGVIMENEEWRMKNGELLDRINNAKPDILLVAFGQKKQEKWIVENLSRLPSVKVAMGIGGTFDFLAGELRRAPTIVRTLGLEWLWRLMLEPKRWKRIGNAVAVFPWYVIKDRFSKTKH